MGRAKKYPAIDGWKTCNECLVSQPEDRFDRNSNQSDGRDPRCKVCRKEAKRISLEANPVSPEKRREYVRRYKERHPERVKQQERRQSLKSKFGMTVEQYDGMLAEQGGVCAICESAPTKRALAVDHDHTDGSVRGLLCSSCNTALGLLSDSPAAVRAALTYLEKRC